ncbi:MAG TPA: 2-hydroxyglutaryl-CoA dehydratase [Firmicutes bacterium]|nr:2-hydroxyglutaryl-CoA dehydratase [Bacillota bacterium]
MTPVYLGVDVGSVSTDIVLVDESGNLLAGEYLMTMGNPIAAIQEGLARIRRFTEGMGRKLHVCGCGVTGSGRQLAGIICGADIVKNEITCHAVAAVRDTPGVNTIIEIGGQDSKITILSNSVVVDFAMNSVCAAGTGSFLDRQAARLGIPIETFGQLALKSKHPVRIAGRCAVFAESDMIHKQQAGHPLEDIVKGLCDALVRNYLANVAKGKKIRPPVLFQGGVASNVGIRRSFEENLGFPVTVPRHHKLMGAIGAALLACKEVQSKPTAFRGFTIADCNLTTRGFECPDCPNRCEVIQLLQDGKTVARWGSRCGKWDLTGEALSHLVDGGTLQA